MKLIQEGRVVLYFIRFDITQPASITNADLIDIWKREAETALAAIEAGVLKHLWKVGGQRIVLGVLEVPSAEDLDRALGGLPIIRSMGAGVRTEAWPIYDYSTFAADLNAGVHGPEPAA